jgi:hypothetical protein
MRGPVPTEPALSAEPPPVLVLILTLFLLMLALLIAGHRLGKRRLAGETDQERVGLVSIETAIFGLMGLIFAFTYAGAAQRFEQRRALTVQEANAIGTVYLRIDLLAEGARRPLRDKVKRYGKSLLAAYDALPDERVFDRELAQGRALQAEIWLDAIAALHDAPPAASQLLIPALNDMFDLNVAHEALVHVKTPGAILGALICLAFLCSVLAGYGLAGTSGWSRYLHMGGFAFVVTMVIYIVIDYDYPRFGLIRIDFADTVLESTIAGMK